MLVWNEEDLYKPTVNKTGSFSTHEFFNNLMVFSNLLNSKEPWPIGRQAACQAQKGQRVVLMKNQNH